MALDSPCCEPWPGGLQCLPSHSQAPAPASCTGSWDGAFRSRPAGPTTISHSSPRPPLPIPSITQKPLAPVSTARRVLQKHPEGTSASEGREPAVSHHSGPCGGVPAQARDTNGQMGGWSVTELSALPGPPRSRSRSLAVPPYPARYLLPPRPRSRSPSAACRRRRGLPFSHAGGLPQSLPDTGPEHHTTGRPEKACGTQCRAEVLGGGGRPWGKI